jgi:RNA polymerase sigma-70 factor, ECF subfamily
VNVIRESAQRAERDESQVPRAYTSCMAHVSADIVQRARLGEPGAIDEFVRGCWAHVWRAAYAVTGDAQLAEDAAQEAFVRALRSLDSLKPVPVGPWLRRIAINCAVDQLRRRRGEWVGSELTTDSSYLDEPSVGDADLAAAVLGLSLERRVVVVLHYWFDYTHQEISTVLEVPAGTVASRLSRALDDLYLRIAEVPSGTKP